MIDSDDSRGRERTFQERLAAYAGCILELGVALRRDQHLLVVALTEHRGLALALAEAAYRRGASFVNILYQDELALKLQLELGGEEAVTFVPKSVRAAYEETIEKNGAFIAISGREDLTAFNQVDPDRQGRSLLARAAQLDFFYQHIYTNRLKWCVAASATAGAARAVFPGQEPARALAGLWNAIFSICRIDERDPLAAWERHLERLAERRRRLDSLGLRELCFMSPTCDFTLRLDPRARWQGGWSVTPDGERFLPNLPTEEVFTVPDCRSLEGRFATTRPLTYKNIHIENVSLAFRKGELVAVEGGSGVEEFRRILGSDPSFRRPGEIALVDADSAVARSGLVFHDLLYDENAQSHVAVGSGYTECLAGVREMSPEERERAGFNTSSLHIDIMFGSSELSVTGRGADGKQVTIMRAGRFADE
jgi:aminopeptidase